jgi:hypothetical protein
MQAARRLAVAEVDHVSATSHDWRLTARCTRSSKDQAFHSIL